jgi:hypothetical protein
MFCTSDGARSRSRVMFFAIVITMVLAIAAPAAWATGGSAPVTYHAYFGDLHAHTSYSDGWEGTPADAYAAAKAVGADFMATTDHAHYIVGSLWQATLAQAAAATTSTFVALPGYEYWMPSSGECNVFNTKNMPPSLTSSTTGQSNPGNRAKSWDAIPALYDWLIARAQAGAVAQYNHPQYMTKDFQSYDGWTAIRDVGMGMLEIDNEGTVAETSFVLALDKGWHVMPTANSDTHYPNWISGYEFRTVLLAPSLTPATLYAAITAQRGYGTEDKNLLVAYTLNGAVMGSTLAAPAASYAAKIHVQDPDSAATDAITKIEIVTDHGVVAASYDVPTTTNTVDWTTMLTAPGARYFYVRVTTASNSTGGPGLTAWTAPVWTSL